MTGGSWTLFLALNLGVDKQRPPSRCAKQACGPLGDGARPYNVTWDVISYMPVSLAMGGALAPSSARWASGDGTAGETGESTLVLAEALGVNFAITEVAKLAMPRPRPFLAFPSSTYDPARTAPDANASFWSGHTSAAFAAAAIGAFDACRSDSPLGCVGPAIGLHTLAASTGLMRVLAGKHHVTDVIVGAAVGSAIGGAVALAHAPKGREGRTAGHAMLGGQAAMLSMMWIW
ncbi:MAG: phosphatase PAP2 family protein [Deltaproteobacteria bacterium]|nr:phosphatase PAP2 family protein [Deltaproteobacteria bacterium]